MKGEQQYGNWLKASFLRRPNRKTNSRYGGSEKEQKQDNSNPKKYNTHQNNSYRRIQNLLLTYTEEFHKKGGKEVEK